MTIKLGGWQRLWVVAAVAYLLVVAGVTWSIWPASASVTHEYTFYSRLTAEARTRILNSQVKIENEQAFIQDARSAKDAELVEMPNGHVLVFRKDLPRAEVEASTQAYWATVEHVAYDKRVVHLGQAVAWWAIPLVLIYALGLAARWIYRGFKQL
jgi:hypothetical protein